MAEKKKEEFKPYVVFDQDKAIGVPEKPFKRADFNDLSKGLTENDDIIFLGVGSASAIPNPLTNIYIELPTGSLTNLSLRWAVHQDTGFYLSGVATPGFTAVVDGAEKTSWSTDGFLVSNLTSGRAVLTSTSGLLVDDAGLTYSLSGGFTLDVGLQVLIGATDQIKLHSTADSYYNGSGNFGFGTTSPDRKVEILSASTQFRITHTDSSLYADFGVSASGDLTIQNRDGTIYITPWDGVLEMNTTSDVSGGPVILDLINNDSAGGHCQIEISVLDVVGDPKIIFQTESTDRFSLGVDHSDSNKFKVSRGSSLGTTDVITIDSASLVTISNSTSTTVPLLDMTQASTGDAATRWALGSTISYALGIDNSVSGDPFVLSTAASASAVLGTGNILSITSGGLATWSRSDSATTPTHDLIQSSTGDTAIRWAVGTTNSFIAGIDNSASDSWKLSYAASGTAVLGTNDYITVTTAGAVSISGLTISGLTSGRVIFAGTGGLLTDDADLTFSTATLTATNIVVTTGLTNSALTSGRVVIASTSGLLADDSDLTFSGATLSATNLTVATSLTLSALTASRLMATDGSKVAASVANLQSWIAGTANQVITADDGDGTITLSLPQSIATGSSPTFAGLTLTGLTAGRVVFVGSSDELTDSAGLTWDDATDTLSITGNAALLEIAQTSTGDALITMSADSTDWTFGIDNSVDNRFAIAHTTALGTAADHLRLTVNGEWSYVGQAVSTGAADEFTHHDFNVAGGTITLTTGATLATQRTFRVRRPTFAADAATQTITNAATVYIENSPAAGTNVAITNAYSLWVDAGTARFDGSVGIGTGGPDRALDVLDATNPQLRLTYTDGSVYVDFQANSSGDLAITPSGEDVAVQKSLSADYVSLYVQNTETTNAASHARLRAISGGASAGDPVLELTINGVTTWSVGADNSDSDKFKIGPALAVGTSTALAITTGGLVGLNTASPDAHLEVLDATGTPQLRLTVTDATTYCDFFCNSSGNMEFTPSGTSFLNYKTLAGGSLLVTCQNNDNTNAASNAYLRATSGGSSAGDAAVLYTINGIINWIAGIDNSDSDSWKIAASSALGTNDFLNITSGGSVTINEGGVDADFRVESDDESYCLMVEGTLNNVVMCANAEPGFNSMDGGVFLSNANVVPAGNPTGGGYLYAEAGALKWRGTSGTVTTIAAA